MAVVETAFGQNTRPNTPGDSMKPSAALCVAAFALGGCALPNVKDVDTSKAQPDCVRQCTAHYSGCVSTVRQREVFQACHDAYQVCVNTCPAK